MQGSEELVGDLEREKQQRDGRADGQRAALGGVPLTKRQMSKPAVRLEAKMTPNRNASSMSAASSGFEVTASSLRGHASRHPEMDAPAPDCGESS